MHIFLKRVIYKNIKLCQLEKHVEIVLTLLEYTVGAMVGTDFVESTTITAAQILVMQKDVKVMRVKNITESKKI